MGLPSGIVGQREEIVLLLLDNGANSTLMDRRVGYSRDTDSEDS